MKNMNKLMVLAVLVMGLASVAYEERIGNVSGTTAQTIIVGTQPKVCIYCTTGSIRYTVGNASTLQTATTSNGAPADFPGDCFRIKMGRGNDRLSIIHKDGTSSFVCEVNAVLE